MIFSKKKSTNISIDSVSLIKAIAIVISALLLLSFIKAIAQALVLLFVAFFLALALNPAVSWIARKLKSKSRVRATGAAYILVLTLLVGILSLIIPPLVKQTADFIKEVPRTLQEFQAGDTALSRLANDYNLNDQVDRFASDFSNRFSDVGQPILTTAGAVLSAFASTIVVLVLTFMMLVEGPAWFDKLLAIQPKSKREQRRQLAYRMYRTVTGYVNGQLLIAFTGAVFALIALFVFGTLYDVDVNEVALAGIIGLFALFPLVGTTIGASIVVIATLFNSVALAITMAIFFVVYQQIENATIQPYIQSKTNKLTPLIVLSSAIIGVSFAGILGALVAIPIAASIKILLEEHYKNRLERAQKN